MHLTTYPSCDGYGQPHIDQRRRFGVGQGCTARCCFATASQNASESHSCRIKSSLTPCQMAFGTMNSCCCRHMSWRCEQPGSTLVPPHRTPSLTNMLKADQQTSPLISVKTSLKPYWRAASMGRSQRTVQRVQRDAPCFVFLPGPDLQ
jgi:hypothetical protein